MRTAERPTKRAAHDLTEADEIAGETVDIGDQLRCVAQRGGGAGRVSIDATLPSSLITHRSADPPRDQRCRRRRCRSRRPCRRPVLHEAGRSVVAEASDGVGGRVRSDIVDGFTLDRGFQILLRAYPELDRQFDIDALDLRSFDPGALVRVGEKLAARPTPQADDTAVVGAVPVGSLSTSSPLKDRAAPAAPTPSVAATPDTSTRRAWRLVATATP